MIRRVHPESPSGVHGRQWWKKAPSRNARRPIGRVVPVLVASMSLGAMAASSPAGAQAVHAAGEPATVSAQSVTAPVGAAVGAASSSAGGGWEAFSSGDVVPFGGAPSYGSLAGVHLTDPIVGIAATPSGDGYWLVASDGGIFAFGDARFLGSTGGIHLTKPIVGMASSPSGDGYWLVASDGGVFGFGDAGFHGSTGGVDLTRPIVGMAATPSGNGYWLVGSDGGIFAFGDARFLGSTGGVHLTKPIVGMASTASGDGYWLVASDGGVFSFGDARFQGALSSASADVAAIAPAAETAGYFLATQSGEVVPFGVPGLASGVPEATDTVVAASVGHKSKPDPVPTSTIPKTTTTLTSRTTESTNPPSTTTTTVPSTTTSTTAPRSTAGGSAATTTTTTASAPTTVAPTTTVAPSTTTTVAPASVLPTPSSLDSTYTNLSFDDEFTGTSLNSDNWETCVWYVKCETAGSISDGNGGVADPADVSVDNGLALSATSSDPTDAQAWDNGWVDSAPYYETPAGGYYVEIEAKLPPAAPGLWPALALYEDTDINPGIPYAEMDLLERVSQPQSNGTVAGPTAFQSWHSASGTDGDGSRQIGGANIDLTGWNTYGVSVSSTGVVQFWFDGSPTGAPFDAGSNALEPMFLSLTLGTGGTPDDGWAGVPTAATPSPSVMDIGYVRVFSS